MLLVFGFTHFICIMFVSVYPSNYWFVFAHYMFQDYEDVDLSWLVNVKEFPAPAFFDQL